MEESAYFTAFFDDSEGDFDYYHYLSILDYEDGLPEIIKAIAERIMERVRSNNVDATLDIGDMPVSCIIPKEHMLFLLGEFILKSSEISNKRITVVAEEFSIKNPGQTRQTGAAIKDSDSTFTKKDYDLLVRLLKAKTMQFAVDNYMSSYIRSHDPNDEQRAIRAIVNFINDYVFWKEDIAYANIFNAAYIPRLFTYEKGLTIHAFAKDHPLIAEQQVVIGADLSKCSVELTVAELYSVLLTISNCYVPMLSREVAVIVESENDYDYIDMIAKNNRNGFISTVYHPTLPFIEACKRFYEETVEMDMIYEYQSNDPLIEQLITLHDLQYNLIDDRYECSEHPPEDDDCVLPILLKPVLYRIGKKATL